MIFPVRLNRRPRQLGAAVIGYLGALGYLAAIRGLPHKNTEFMWGWAIDWRLLFVFALVGAVTRAGLADYVGTSSPKGWPRDIALTVFGGAFAALVEAALHEGPFGPLVPVAAVLSLSVPAVTLAMLVEALAFLAYARLTAPKTTRPPTIPRA